MKVCAVAIAAVVLTAACGPTEPDDTLDVLCVEQCMRDGAQIGKTRADCSAECDDAQPAADPHDPNEKDEE